MNCSPKYAIYEAITDQQSPRYILEPDGNVQRAGSFEQTKRTRWPFESQVRWELDKSAIYRTLANREPRASEDDVRLTLATVPRSRNLLAAEYPGIQFHVILWRPWEEIPSSTMSCRTGFAK